MSKARENQSQTVLPVQLVLISRQMYFRNTMNSWVIMTHFAMKSKQVYNSKHSRANRSKKRRYLSQF